MEHNNKLLLLWASKAAAGLTTTTTITPNCAPSPVPSPSHAKRQRYACAARLGHTPAPLLPHSPNSALPSPAQHTTQCTSKSPAHALRPQEQVHYKGQRKDMGDHRLHRAGRQQQVPGLGAANGERQRPCCFGTTTTELNKGPCGKWSQGRAAGREGSCTGSCIVYWISCAARWPDR